MIDPRLAAIQESELAPAQTADAQMAVIFDNLFAGYLKNPALTDGMLRRNGLTRTADRLVELFGERWWELRQD